MLASPEYTILVEGLRTLFLLAVPILVVVSLAGTIISIFQSATNMPEPALGYAARILALVAVLYFMLPSFSRSLIELAQLAWR